jgi:hypothetical protein
VEKAEFGRRGDALYERDVRPRVEPAHLGEFVAIDIGTGDFEVDPDELAAVDRLRARRPDAAVWLRRVGERAAHRFGRGHSARAS